MKFHPKLYLSIVNFATLLGGIKKDEFLYCQMNTGFIHHRIIFICALHSEAKPLITTLGLKKITNCHPFTCFEQGKFLLVVSGVGLVRAAAATSWILTKCHNLESVVVINVGIAGCESPSSLGKIFRVNKITCQETGRSYYPDMLVKLSLEEMPLATVLRPVLSPPRKEDINLSSLTLIDMEGSAIFETAYLFLLPSQFQFFKIVSDCLHPPFPDARQATILIETHVHSVVTYAEHIAEHISTTATSVDPASTKWFVDTCQKLKLTETQKVQLQRSLTYHIFLARETGGSPLLPEVLPTSNKVDREIILRKIHDSLLR